MTLKEAVLSGLAPDGGLYMPAEIPKLESSTLKNADNLTLHEISEAITTLFAGEEVPPEGIQGIIHNALTFPAPVHFLNDQIASLELFHGPSLAFKDFGARFMAHLMSWFIRNDSEPLHILVATSGDTGGAVALGFHNVPGIEVSILYPKGRVSDLQEKQLTTHDGNIHAYEIEGSFDDCQRMVKEAFLDSELRGKLRLTSANSINISRLIPQTFYYFNALAQACRLDSERTKRPFVFSVPSGNFGNLCAGVMAKMMGARIDHFLAATNINDVVPKYLHSGEYSPMESLRTISNAMDVGNPSNFERLSTLFECNLDQFKELMSGYRYTDDETKNGLLETWEEHHYISDPHGASGYLAAKDYLSTRTDNPIVVFLETAHPIKFQDDVEESIKSSVATPPQVGSLLEKEKKAALLPPTLEALKEQLLPH